MYLVRVDNDKDLMGIAADWDVLADLDHIDLGEVDALVLAELSVGAASAWYGKLLLEDHDGGLLIGEFQPAGVVWLTENADELVDFGVDGSSLACFAARCQTGRLYFLENF